MTNHSNKMMWACVALVALVVIVYVAGGNGGYLLFAVPCTLMMGAVMWMMIGRIGRGSRNGDGT